MSLNFPKNPNDGDEFNGFVHDAARGLWKVKFRADPFESVDIANVQAGEAIIYDGTKWVTDKVSSAEVKVVSATDEESTINIDFSDGVPLEKITVAGNITFTGSNYTAGVEKKILLVGDTSSRSLTFPLGWNFINGAPTAVGANNTNILEVSCFGTTEDSIFANFDGPSSFSPIIASGGTEADILINNITYRTHTFTSSGALNVASIGDIGEAEYFIVSGGAGGQAGHSNGGGGGKFVSGSMSLSASTYNVVVGAGGSGGPSGQSGGNGSSGGSSSFGLVSTNGAGSPSGAGPTGAAAGSQGLGAGGTNGSRAGGDGQASSISGTTLHYAGGGGGGGGSGYETSPGGQGGLGGGGNGGTANNVPGTDGEANTGGGGGAGGIVNGGAVYVAGRSGGSGIVIIRYPITDPN